MERLVIRVGTLAVLAASVVLAAVMHTPSRLPATAFGSALLLYFERLVVVAVALLFLLVVAYRGWRGDLPTRLSERGAEWEPLRREGDAVQADLVSMKTHLDDIQSEIEVLGRRVDSVEVRTELR